MDCLSSCSVVTSSFLLNTFAAKFYTEQNTMYWCQSRTPTAWKTAKIITILATRKELKSLASLVSQNQQKQKVTKENSRQQVLVEQYLRSRTEETKWDQLQWLCKSLMTSRCPWQQSQSNWPICTTPHVPAKGLWPFLCEVWNTKNWDMTEVHWHTRFIRAKEYYQAWNQKRYFLNRLTSPTV